MALAAAIQVGVFDRFGGRLERAVEETVAFRRKAGAAVPSLSREGFCGIVQIPQKQARFPTEKEEGAMVVSDPPGRLEEYPSI